VYVHYSMTQFVRKGDELKYRFGVQKTWGSDPRLLNKRSSGATETQKPRLK